MCNCYLMNFIGNSLGANAYYYLHHIVVLLLITNHHGAYAITIPILPVPITTFDHGTQNMNLLCRQCNGDYVAHSEAGAGHIAQSSLPTDMIEAEFFVAHV